MKQNILKFPFLAAMCAVAAVGSVKAADELSVATHSPTVTNQVTLDELVKEALEKNPELKFYETEIAAAKAGRKTAGALANPEGDFVYTASGKHFVRAAIKTDEANADFVGVTDGLYAGDRIVTQPVMTLWLAELQAIRGGK